jgi:hypothetical protein
VHPSLSGLPQQQEALPLKSAGAPTELGRKGLEIILDTSVPPHSGQLTRPISLPGRCSISKILPHLHLYSKIGMIKSLLFMMMVA